MIGVAADTSRARRVFCRMSLPRADSDPFRWYGQLRAMGSLVPVDTGVGAPVVLVTTYADCAAILRDRGYTAITVDYRDTYQPGWRDHVFTRCLYRSMLFHDGGVHASARAVVNRYFTPRAVADLRTTLPSIVDSLLSDVDDRGTPVDLQERLAVPYAALVTGLLLGIADADMLALAPLLRHTEPVLELSVTPAQHASMLAAGTEVCDRLGHLIRYRRADPGADVVSALVRGGGSDEDVLAATVLLLGAAFDSPASMVGLGIRLFLDHPVQADAVRTDPGLGAAATEEILRYEPPVHIVARLNTAPVRVAGAEVPPGTLFLLLVAAANRDPAVVGDGDRFDVRRRTTGSLSLGAGPHYCLGGAVARLAGEALFPVLLQRFAGMVPAGPSTLRDPATMLRGLAHLPVRLRG